MSSLFSKPNEALSIKDATTKIYKDCIEVLSELSISERLWRIFWLAGPFILLIERSPADAWVSLIGLAFIVRSIRLKQGKFLSVFWVRTAFVFWFVCLISALFSDVPYYAFIEAIIWFRFPLFAMASVFWLGTDKRLIYMMLITTGVAMLIMCCILAAEIYFVGHQPNGRLSWPYGDLTSGNYLAKVGLPAFLVMVALAVGARSKIASVAALLSLISLIFSLLTGERINFLIRACAGMLAGLMWRPKWRRYCLLVIVEILAVVILFKSSPQLSERFVTSFIDQLPTHVDSPYYKSMMPGIIAFQKAPILGVGTAAFRELCPEIIENRPELKCHPHPHNFYIQMAGETGIIGLLTGTVFLFSIITTCYLARKQNPDNVFAAIAFIVPFSLFWPIASSGDFFGQWNNCFTWSAVALSLCATNILPEKTNIN
ncbi:O-antigen ligase family protein [Alphaproteobacteria bacterium]|nr:O-antigen ligase family protein [Alphaproteobacteria bacterium]